MNILLGMGIIDPITVLFFSTKRGGRIGVCNEIIKLYLLNPDTDGIRMLKELHSFILNLDILDEHSKAPYSDTFLIFFCKSYYSIAKNTNLSMKIKSDNFVDISASAFFKDVLKNSFFKNTTLRL